MTTPARPDSGAGSSRLGDVPVRKPQIEYDDFELKVMKVEHASGPREGYIARVIRSPVGEGAEHPFLLPFSEIQLENLVLKLSGRAGIRRRVHSAAMLAARLFGCALFSAVFGGEVLAMFRSSLFHAKEKGTGLRIQLRLQDVPELANLPWEFLCDEKSPHDFFAQSIYTPIVRYLEMLQWRSIKISLPIRILLMAPISRQGTNLDVEREVKLLDKALKPLSELGKVAVTRLNLGTLSELQAALRTGEFHIFHFVGHGGFDEVAEEGVLVLVDDQQQERQTKAHVLATILQDHRTLRLALLNSCEGARNSPTDPFAGVATALVQKGLPAVIAMQFEISDPAALTFAKEFYSSLVDGYPVDGAVAEARKAIYAAQPDDLEWATPVLVLRGRSGDADRLFEFDNVITPPPPPPPPPRELPRTEEQADKKESRQSASALRAEIRSQDSGIDRSQSATSSEVQPQPKRVDRLLLWLRKALGFASKRDRLSDGVRLTIGAAFIVGVIGMFQLPVTHDQKGESPTDQTTGTLTEIGRIYFDLDMATMRPDGKATVDKLCPEWRVLLNRDLSLRLLLEGYAQDSPPTPMDKLGDKIDHYMNLGKRRAESAKAYIVETCDLPPDRLLVEGQLTPEVEVAVLTRTLGGPSLAIKDENRFVRVSVQRREK